MSPWVVTSNCRHGPSRAIAVMGRHERFRSELAAGFEAQKKNANLDGDVLLSVSTEDQTSTCTTGSCFGRSRNSRTMSSAAAPEKQPPQQESPSVEDWRQQGTADLDVAPSYSPGRNETSRTGPNAPPELAQTDFACSASGETKKLEPTFGLHRELDESRRLKVMNRTASPRELAEFQVFPRRCQRVGKMGVATRTVVKIVVKTPPTTADGGQAQRQQGGGTVWIDQGALGPLRRALGAKASCEHQVRPSQGRASPPREGFPRAPAS